MPKWSDQLRLVNFSCSVCRHAFEAEPDLIEDDPDTAHHPFRYFADCPGCGAQHQPQAGWERALLKAHQAATGPRTAEGKASSARNLAGHPTPEEAMRTRFNALKHGLSARVASYFPARPDRYAFCARCDVNRGWCADQPACVKQTEIFMLHHAAFEQRDPKILGRLHGDLQAALTATLQMCLQEILGEGVVIKVPKVELSRDGFPVTLTYEDRDGEKHTVYDYHSNPVFKPLTDLISRLGLSMSDLGMTVRANEAEDEAESGQLVLDSNTRETLNEFSQRMLEATKGARAMIAEAADAARKDPVLIQHQAQGGDE